MSRPSSLTLRSPSVFPDNMFVKLKYTERQSQTHAAGIGVEWIYRGNSLYDPNAVVGVGHQPYGFNQWEQLYGYYTVYGSSVRVTLMPNVSVSTGWDLAVVPHTAAAGILSAAVDTPVEEMPYAKHRHCSVYQQGTRYSEIRSYMSTAKIFGANPVAIKAEDNYSASVGANPVSPWYWSIITQPMDQATNNANYVQVSVTYYVEFSGRKNFASST